MMHVAGKGVLLRSMDDGRTWTKLPVPETKKLNDVVFRNEQVGWTTDFDGTILETRDGGQTWATVYRHRLSTVLTAIHESPERLVVASTTGVIVRRPR